MTPCEGIVEISPFVLKNLPALVELGGSFPPRLEIRNSLHMHPNLELYSTQLDSLRFLPVSYQEGEEGEEVTASDARLCFFFQARIL